MFIYDFSFHSVVFGNLYNYYGFFMNFVNSDLSTWEYYSFSRWE